MVKYLKSVVNQANSISNNDLSQNIEVKSNKDELGLALSTMTELLRTNDNKIKMKFGLVKVYDYLQMNL